jgi:regulator-associated protein of mTOR
MQVPPLISTLSQAGGFLVAGATHSSNASPPQFLHSPSFQDMPPPDPRSPVRPSVFEDHARLELDLAVLDKLIDATNDASVLVRHEATLGIARAVGKYTEAFVSVASGLVSATSKFRQSASSRRTFPIPRGLERRYLLRFESAWQVLRKLQHEDPFPKVAKVANDIVSVVHEHLLRFRMEVEKAETSTSEDLLGLHPKKLANTILAGIDEEINSEDMNDYVPDGAGLASSFSPKKPELHELRRVASEFAMARSPIESAVRKAFSADDMPMHYSLPESQFYEWKKGTFDLMLDIDEDEEDADPLSPNGAARAYQEWRNASARDSGILLSKEFELLAPKPPKPSLKTIESLLEEEEDDETSDQAIAAAKGKLKMRETGIIRSSDGRMTSMLAFHPYEDVIMACGSSGIVTLWSTVSLEKLATIDNGNPSPSRITYSTWMNEESSSLFVVGCDDGSVRIWGDLLEPNGEPTATRPTLITAFFAASMNPGQVGRSGLVCEWQPFSGTLLSGGNSDYLACWDVESEKKFLQLETNSEACITTLTTAWDSDALGVGPSPPGYKGLGQDVILAGFSNGSMKIFDLRASRAVTDMTTIRPHRSRITGFSEHKNWIVNCAFTGYGDRYEFISGTTAGDIRAWDLRMSRSVRTFEAHRSGMTTMAVHSKVPLVATGTSSQFIKLLSPDGKVPC